MPLPPVSTPRLMRIRVSSPSSAVPSALNASFLRRSPRSIVFSPLRPVPSALSRCFLVSPPSHHRASGVARAPALPAASGPLFPRPQCPGSPLPWQHLIEQSYMTLCQTQVLLDTLHRPSASSIVSPTPRRPGRFMTEVPSSQSLLSATRHQTVEVLLQESQQWLEGHHYGQALATCDRALALQPDSAKAWLCRGRILSLTNQPEKALNAHRKAAALDKTCVAAWYNQAIVLHRLGQPSEAVLALNQTLALQPQFSEAWFKRGQFLAELEQYQEAFLSYSSAIESNRYWVKASPGQAWAGRGHCLNLLGKYHAAVEAYSNAIKENPQDWHLHQVRVQILQKIGHLEDEKPKDEAPKDPESWGWAL